MMQPRIEELSAAHRPWAFALKAPYKEAFVQAIKEGIPSRARKWDAASGRWFVKDGQFLALEALAIRYFGTVAYGPEVAGAGYMAVPRHKQIIKLQVAAIIRKAA